ncbi:MAG TPA: protein kinase [Bacteroidota bacterium]|nr:protein kinase [Bacteroidota bacterium]
MNPSVTPRYRIIHEVGRGGMGVVYEAEDLRLHRTVALKFLPGDLGPSADEVARFQHEAEAISSLNHPNIATIYDIDEADGRKFLTLEFIAGGTLKAKLRHAEPPGSGLPVADVIEYGTQMARALAHAHGQGIIHRDVKTDNVMLTGDGAVKLTDFGLAKLKGRGQITREGSTMGTAAYVSPEQLRSEEADHRSDIFSFGVVLYEILTGHIPFRGDHESALTYSIAHEDPVPVEAYRKDAPAALVKIVMRCLEKDPAKRYQDAGSIAADLERLRQSPGGALPAVHRRRIPAWGIAAAFALVAAAAVYFLLAPARAPQANSRSIAVLPFANLSGKPEDEYFSDGVTEDILTELSKIADLNVISRTSVMQYKGTTKTIREIGKELNVGVILEGSIQREGDQVRIVAQLIDAGTDRHLWAETYDKEFKQIFAIQSDVAQRIAAALQAKLSSAEKEQLEARPTSSTEAYTAYLKGRHHWNRRTPEDLHQAVDYFKEAVALDPSYALAYAGLAESYTLIPEYAWEPAPEMFRLADEAARRALALDPSLGEAHAVSGLIKMDQLHYAEAEEELARAVALSPGNASVHQWYSLTEGFRGKLGPSLEEMKKARDLDPLSLVINADIAYDQMFLKDYDGAVDQFNKTLDLDPRFVVALSGLAETYALKGAGSQAVGAAERARALAPRDPLVLGILGFAYGRNGQNDSARSVLDTLLAMSARSADIGYFVAFVYAGLGDREETLRWLSKSVDESEIHVRSIKIDPSWDDVRGDPRFAAMVKKLGL